MISVAEVVDGLQAMIGDLVVVDHGVTGGPVAVAVEDVRTFAELGILTSDPGVVVRFTDGRAVALTASEYRYHRY